MPGDIHVRFTPKGAAVVGQRVVELINENVAAGRGPDGELAPYGVHPFARPIGGLPKVVVKRLDDAGAIQRFTTAGGQQWIVVLGGYVALKRALNPAWTGKVDLAVTGDMMRQLSVIRADGEGIEIGFLTREASEKAFWIENARRPRHFLGLTTEQYASLGDVLDETDLEFTGSISF